MSESTKKKFYQTDGFRMFMGKYGIGVILIFMILVIGVMKPRFLYPSNILNVLTQISVNCLIAYGMCLCITTGGIDLSVGPQLALVSVLLGQFIVVRGMNIGVSIVLAVLAATAFGFLIAIVLMAGLREKIEYNDIPKPFQGTAIVLITACLMSIAFMGFSGMI